MNKYFLIFLAFSFEITKVFSNTSVHLVANICAADITITCEQNSNPEFTGYPQLDSNYTTPTFWDEIISNSCPKVIVRHWSSMSDINEAFECTQTITIEDSTAPTIFISDNLIFDCAQSIALPYTVNDCDENVTSVITWGNISTGDNTICPPGTYRTQTQGGWGAAPSGNNPGTYLYAHFTEAFPNGLTIGCNNTLTLSTPEAITAFLPSGSTSTALPTGNLLNPGGAYSNVLAGQLVAATLNTTFDAYYSNFGTDTMWVGNLLINEGVFQGMSLSELINIANEVIGGCNENFSYTQVNAALTLFNQNFDNGTVNNNYLHCGSMPNPCMLNQTYTITATDMCGNISTLDGIIELNDNTGPVFVEASAEVTIDCSQWPLDTLLVTDPCGISAHVISMTETEFSGPCLPIVERTYTAADACGNVSTFTQYIHITDNVAPIVSNIPMDLQLSCANEVTSTEPSFNDNCDSNLEIVYTELSTGSACTGTIIRTWTATDQCGNSTSVSQSIVISDQIDPIFTYVPSDTAIPCGSSLPEPTATALDNCSAVTLTHVDSWVLLNGSCKYLQRHFTATDACGNSAEAMQNIYFTDTIAPVLSQLPADMTGDCTLATAVPTITATDNCTVNVLVTYSETQNTNGCTTTISRTWTATDDCGNSTSHTQILVLVDSTPPQFNAADNAIIPCSQIANYTIPVTDNCGTVSLSYSDFISGMGCTIQLVRTWIAVDACNNSNQFVQTIQLTDTQAPVFTYVPQSYSISCGTTPPVQNAVASDNCSANLVPVMTQTITGSGCAQVITRTWTVTDNCGNSATATQNINVTDNVNPVFTGVPSNITISCGQVPTVPSVTAIDNCSGNLTVNYTETAAGAGCDTHIVRMWTATDLCGNTITATQHIYIDDNTPPTWTNVPAAITLNCNASVPPLVNPVATDNCSSVTNTFYFEYTESAACGQILHRVWQAIDGCGNSSNVSQLVSFIDSTVPTFTSTPPALIEAQCGNIPQPHNVQATDNCSSVSISMIETIITNGCPYTLRRIWNAVDNCGNHATFIQNIMVTDTELPVLHNLPSDITISCGSVAPIANVTVTDNCSGNINVTMQETSITQECSQIITRTFGAMDLCGNTSFAQQIITVVDDASPILFNTPADLEIECGSVPAPAEVTAIDACQGALPVIYSEEIIDINSQFICELTNAHSFMGDIAFWLPGLNGVGANYTFVANTAQISINDIDGTANITGELQNTLNPDQRWFINMQLVNKRNWTEWHALGRGYKDDLAIAGNNYINWSYYELAPTSQLTGSGLLAGSLLQITHAPSTYYYGFQIGVAANNRNTAYGMSGWIYYNGNVNGDSVSGHGDFYAENTCCPEQQIIRQWLATDCAGNTTVHTQQIHVVGSGPIAQTAPIVNGMEMEVYYTSSDRFNVNIQTNRTTNVTVEFYTNSGQFLGSQTKYLNQPNIPCKIEIDGQLLENGMYLFRAYDGSQSVTKRALKIR